MTFLDTIYTDGIVINAPIEAVAAGLDVYLKDLKIVSFRRPYTAIRPIAVYQLLHNLDGNGYGPDLGQIRLRFLGENRTNIQMISPSPPSDDEIRYHVLGWSYWENGPRKTPEEIQLALQEKAIRENRLQRWPVPDHQWFERSKNLIEQGRIEIQHSVVSFILERLQKDGMLIEQPDQAMEQNIPLSGWMEKVSDSDKERSNDGKRLRSSHHSGGRPYLRESNPDEYITRMAQALWAKEVREQSFEIQGESLTWKQTLVIIGVKIPAPKNERTIQNVVNRIVRDQKKLKKLLDENDPILRKIRQRKARLQRDNAHLRERDE